MKEIELLRKHGEETIYSDNGQFNMLQLNVE